VKLKKLLWRRVKKLLWRGVKKLLWRGVKKLHWLPLLLLWQGYKVVLLLLKDGLLFKDHLLLDQLLVLLLHWEQFAERRTSKGRTQKRRTSLPWCYRNGVTGQACHQKMFVDAEILSADSAGCPYLK
jgi:hypothetical protein